MPEMLQIEYTTVDKSSWPRGPWDKEPDKVQYVDLETGLPCLIVRNRFGALCGYVGVDRSHVDFEQIYHDLNYSVHGDLTFSDFCQPDSDPSHGICHITLSDSDHEPIHEPVWWLGFDCGHCFDYQPGWPAEMLDMINSSQDCEYRTMWYVKSELRDLAKQVQARGGQLVATP